MSYGVEQSDIHYYTFGANFLAESSLWDDLCSQTGRAALRSVFNPLRNYPSPFAECTEESGLRATFSRDSSRTYVEESLWAYKMPERFTQERGDLRWGEWLSLPPSRGGITAASYLELLRWNLDETKQRNASAEERINTLVKDFDEALTGQVDTGVLSPLLLRKWQKRRQSLKVVVSGPLDVAYGNEGQYYPYENVAKLTPSGLKRGDVTTHEFAHSCGSFRNPLLNKATTTLIESALVAPECSSAYAFSARTLREILSEADVSLRAFSHIFASSFSTVRERRAKRALRQSSLGHFIAFSSQVFDCAKQIVKPSLVHQVAGLYLAQKVGIGDSDKLIREEYGQYTDSETLDSFSNFTDRKIGELSAALQP